MSLKFNSFFFSFFLILKTWIGLGGGSWRENEKPSRLSGNFSNSNSQYSHNIAYKYSLEYLSRTQIVRGSLLIDLIRLLKVARNIHSQAISRRSGLIVSTWANTMIKAHIQTTSLFLSKLQLHFRLSLGFPSLWLVLLTSNCHLSISFIHLLRAQIWIHPDSSSLLLTLCLSSQSTIL